MEEFDEIFYENNSEGMFRRAFTTTGRIRRTEYIISLIIANVLLLGIVYLVDSSRGNGSFDYTFYGLARWPIIIWLYVQAIKRCHDLGMSGWWSLCPVFNPFALIFAGGDEGINEYGSNPRRPYEEQVEEEKAYKAELEARFAQKKSDVNNGFDENAAVTSSSNLYEQSVSDVSWNEKAKKWLVIAGIGILIIAVIGVYLALSSPSTSMSEQLTPAQKDLKDLVVNTNNRCPSNENGLILERVGYENDTFTVHYSTQMENGKIFMGSSARKIWLLIFLASDEGTKDMGKVVKADANMTIRYSYKEKDTIFVYPADELKVFMNGRGASHNTNYLEAMVLVQNDLCPQKVDDYTIWHETALTIKEFIFEYELTGADIDPSSLYPSNPVFKELKENIRKEMKSDVSFATKQLIKALVNTKRQLVCRYNHRPSGKKVNIVFTTEELSEIQRVSSW